MAWSSAEMRTITSNALKATANWIQPEDSDKTRKNPKHFQIPNPFYKDEKKNDNNRFK